MIPPPLRQSGTTLNDSEYGRCLKIAERYLQKHDSIRNRDIREVAGIGYDQAIGFFNRATNEKWLFREGSGGGTRYVLAKRRKRSR